MSAAGISREGSGTQALEEWICWSKDVMVNIDVWEHAHD